MAATSRHLPGLVVPAAAGVADAASGDALDAAISVEGVVVVVVGVRVGTSVAVAGSKEGSRGAVVLVKASGVGAGVLSLVALFLRGQHLLLLTPEVGDALAGRGERLTGQEFRA